MCHSATYLSYFETSLHVQWFDTGNFDDLRSLWVQQQIVKYALLAQRQPIPFHAVQCMVDLIALWRWRDAKKLKELSKSYGTDRKCECYIPIFRQWFPTRNTWKFERGIWQLLQTQCNYRPTINTNEAISYDVFDLALTVVNTDAQKILVNTIVANTITHGTMKLWSKRLMFLKLKQNVYTQISNRLAA